MMFSVVTKGGQALDIFIIPLWKRGGGEIGKGEQGEKVKPEKA